MLRWTRNDTTELELQVQWQEVELLKNVDA